MLWAKLMKRLNVAFDEGKETVGSFVLDAITPLVSGIVNKVIPAVSLLAEDIGKKLAPAFANIATFFKDVLIPIFQSWWSFITEIVIPGVVNVFQPILEGLFEAFGKIAKTIKNNEDNLKPLFNAFKAFASFVAEILAPVLGEVLGAALKVVGTLLSGLITGFAKLVGFIDGVVQSIGNLIRLVQNNPIVKGVSNLVSSAFGGFRANGGAVTGGTPYVVGERGAELFVPKSNGTIIPNGMGGGTTINLTVNGAIDPEGTARQIIQVLNRSQARGALGAGALTF
jgi:phage-related protein